MVGSGATPSEWYDYTPRYDVIIKGCSGATPSEWYGHTPYCGVMINAMSCTIFASWCGNKWAIMGATPQQCYPHLRGCGYGKWAMIRQPHRGCTFDSPGLPTIGGYPGEQGVWNTTPLGVVLSLFVLLNASHVTIRGIASS